MRFVILPYPRHPKLEQVKGITRNRVLFRLHMLPQRVCAVSRGVIILFVTTSTFTVVLFIWKIVTYQRKRSTLGITLNYVKTTGITVPLSNPVVFNPPILFGRSNSKSLSHAGFNLRAGQLSLFHFSITSSMDCGSSQSIWCIKYFALPIPPIFISASCN